MIPDITLAPGEPGFEGNDLARFVEQNDCTIQLELLFGPVTTSFLCPFMNMHQGNNKKLNDVDKEA